MQLGIIGLGRMGGNIARRLMLNGHTTVVYDRNEAFVKGLAGEGATRASIQALWHRDRPAICEVSNEHCTHDPSATDPLRHHSPR